MRILSTLPLLASLVSAQYVSQGWRPGQQVRAVPQGEAFDPSKPRPTAQAPYDSPDTPAAAKPVVETKPASPASPVTGGFWEKLFTTGPIGELVAKTGINVTRVIEKQHIDESWDTRIPLIYDETFNETVVSEVLTPEEEDERVWALLVSGGPQSSQVSKWVDEQFDEAYNISQIAGDLPHVRWGRINYADVTYLTTRWGIWKAPVLVLATNRAKTLRFFYPKTLNMRAEILHKFLEIEGWEEIEPWSGPYAPGGESEWIAERFAQYMQLQFNFISKTPRMILVLMTGGLTSFLIQLLHRGKGKQEEKVTRKILPRTSVQPATTAAPAAATASVTESPSAGESAKKRKQRKK